VGAVVGLQRLQDVGHVQAEVAGDLARAGRPAVAAAQLLGRAHDLGLQLADPARYPDRRRAVAVVALDLAADRGDGEGQEVHTPAGVEAVDGVDQPERGDLLEVLGVLPAVAVLAGDVAGDRQVTGDQLAAQGLPPGVVGGQPVALAEQRGEVLVAVGGSRVPVERCAGSGGRLIERSKHLCPHIADGLPRGQGEKWAPP
jgi:hypothetical protein